MRIFLTMATVLGVSGLLYFSVAKNNAPRYLAAPVQYPSPFADGYRSAVALYGVPDLDQTSYGHDGAFRTLTYIKERVCFQIVRFDWESSPHWHVHYYSPGSIAELDMVTVRQRMSKRISKQFLASFDPRKTSKP